MSLIEPRPEELVRKDHPYRKLLSIVSFSELTRSLKSLYRQDFGRPGYHVESGFAALVLQWMEDLSDRELERFLQENNAAKYFCGFSLGQKTPDHTYFCELRKRIGTTKLADLFNMVGDKLRQKGLTSEVFNFVDASNMISKVSLWEARDKAIKDGEKRLNNSNIGNYSSDKNATIGCRGRDKFWYGYKRHISACMKHGIITKTAATPANKSDADSLKHVCPKQGMIIADKAYSGKKAQTIIKQKGCHSGVILKNNMIGKDYRKDNFLTRLSMPYEGIFSKMSKRVRYQGIAKVQFQVFMQALVHNLKRLIAINAPPILLPKDGFYPKLAKTHKINKKTLVIDFQLTSFLEILTSKLYKQ